MKSKPLFSVIVRIYNSEEFLSECIESVINQKFKNIEMILIDDGSTDNSVEICKKYFENDDRIIFIHQSNHGVSYSCKKGIEIASGEYLAFVDSDDSIDPDMFSKIAEVVKEKTPDVLAFGLKEVYSDHILKKDNKYEYKYYNKEQIKKYIFPSMISYFPFFEFGILPNLAAKVIKRELLIKICSNISDEVIIGEDADFSFQSIAEADSIQTISFFPYNYFKRNDSLMYKPINIKNINALKKDLLSCFKKKGLSSLMKDQLDRYISFVKALKCPDYIDVIKTFFADINMRCALYGAGGFGYALFETFRNSITCWTDKNATYYQNLGMPVFSVEDFIEKGSIYDSVFISILNTSLCEQIKEELKLKGVRKDIYYFDGYRICP